MRMVAPIAIGVVFTVIFAASLATGYFPLGKEFKSTTIVRQSSFENSGNFESSFFVSAVENIFGKGVVVSSMSAGLYLEAPVEYNETLAANFKTQLVQLGVPENTISVLELNPSVSTAQLVQMSAAFASALVVIGVASLILYRRRRIGWAAPLVIALDFAGILGVVTLLRIPFGVGAVIGTLIVFVQAICINTALVSRTKASEGSERLTREITRLGTMIFVSTIIFFGIFAMMTGVSQAFELLAVLLIGFFVNFLNTSWLNVGLSMKKVQPTQVRYDVSL